MGLPVKEKVIRNDGMPTGSSAPLYTVHPGNLEALEACIPTFKILIIDFGQAYFFDNPPDSVTSPSQFKAPEVLFDMTHMVVSPSTDIWALGCNIFEICSGYTLFKALFNPRQDVLRDIVAMLGKPPHELWEGWSEKAEYFDSNATPIRASEDSIMTVPYSLYDRVCDIAWLYPPEGQDLDPGMRKNLNQLESVELTQLYDLLKEIFKYDSQQRVAVKTAIQHPFLNPGVDIASCMRLNRQYN